MNPTYTSLPKRTQGHLQSLYKSEEQVAIESLTQLDHDAIEKGRKGEPIGTKKTWGGKEYVKTAQGWTPSKKAKEAHDVIHGNSKLESAGKMAEHIKTMSQNARAAMDKFLKRKGITIEDYKGMSEKDKDKLNEEWRSSDEYKESNGEKKEEGRQSKIMDQLKNSSVDEGVRKEIADYLTSSEFDKDTTLESFKGSTSEETKANLLKLGAFKDGYFKPALANTLAEHLHAGDKKDESKDSIPESVKELFQTVRKEGNFSFMNFKGRIWKRDNKTGEITDHQAASKNVELPKSGAASNKEIDEANRTREKREYGEELKAGDKVVVNHDHPETKFTGEVVESYGVNGVKVKDAQGRASVYSRKDVKGANSTSDFDSLAKKLSKLTANNNHTESLKHLAKEIGNAEALDKLNDIAAKQEKQGYLSMEQSSERYGIYQEIMEDVKKQFGEDVYKKIKASL